MVEYSSKKVFVPDNKAKWTLFMLGNEYVRRINNIEPLDCEYYKLW